ncbi:hypothetical protein pdam_00006763 [Pocillopora damicornis]|uniref:Uncharacterized protein n=1 Tax=Pocillopora damicornis TaxID=46731 RepID=A0A3M6UVY7_POCDA|nr:hypothetical protein pdam_00006763 [Pocillopora damicornis]
MLLHLHIDSVLIRFKRLKAVVDPLSVRLITRENMLRKLIAVWSGDRSIYYSRILFFSCTSCLHDNCSEENVSILSLKRCIKYIKHHSFLAL